MVELLEYRWQPIQDLPDDWESPKDAELHSLMIAWQEQSQAMQRGNSYQEFLVQLNREWTIETGQIERLYDISRGAAKTLIEQGFDAAVLSHDDTDRPTEEVLDYVTDQRNAIEKLYQFVGGDRSLGTSYRSGEPFYLAHNDPLDQVRDRFSKWIDEALVEGLDYWRKAIGA